MNEKIANGFLGTSSLVTTSTINQSIISDLPDGQGIRALNFVNYNDCTITIYRNITALKTIFLKAYQGWNMRIYDLPITDIKIAESGVQYNYYGSYGYLD